MPQQGTSLQLRRSGFGLNDQLGDAACDAGKAANRTPHNEGRRFTRNPHGDMQPKMAPQ